MVTTATATGGRTSVRTTASMGAGSEARVIRAGGSPSKSRGGTAKVRTSRWTTSASKDQCVARSPIGQPRTIPMSRRPPNSQTRWRLVACQFPPRVSAEVAGRHRDQEHPLENVGFERVGGSALHREPFIARPSPTPSYAAVDGQTGSP